MAYMEVSRVEVTEVIRRWQAGGSQRHISAAIGMSRSTVRKYITAAVQAGLRQGRCPSDGRAAHQPGADERIRSSDGGDTDRGYSGTLGRPGLPVAHCRTSPDHPYPGAVVRTRVPSLLHIAEAVSCNGGAGVNKTPGLSGWRRPRLGKWRRWTSVAWDW